MTTPTLWQRLQSLWGGKPRQAEPPLAASQATAKTTDRPGSQSPSKPRSLHGYVPLKEAKFAELPAAQFEQELLLALEAEGVLQELACTSGTNSRYWLGWCPVQQLHVELAVTANGYNSASRLAEDTAWLVRVRESGALTLSEHLQHRWQKSFIQRKMSGMQQTQFVFKR